MRAKEKKHNTRMQEVVNGYFKKIHDNLQVPCRDSIHKHTKDPIERIIIELASFFYFKNFFQLRIEKDVLKSLEKKAKIKKSELMGIQKRREVMDACYKSMNSFYGLEIPQEC